MLFDRYADGLYVFRCPGCNTMHGFDGRWTLSGTEDAPTVRPSIVHGDHCQLYITAGTIEYLDGCSHSFKGKTIPMVPIEEDIHGIR